MLYKSVQYRNSMYLLLKLRENNKLTKGVG